MYRNNGYEVKVFNLVTPEHSDSWNCMSDLNGDTLMAQVLTNVIIGNTSSGKGDHFWDNGEGNLLKALILLVDQDRSRNVDMKHLPAVYQALTQHSERQLTAIFEKLPLDHPARAPYNLFSQSSDTVRSGIILGLGTRLQVLQNEAVQKITSRSDIDLTLPAKRKCAYYIVLSDQDATMAFLSSLFFSCMFIKLTRYADSRPNGSCDVPVNLILDEFNNIGKLGAAPDGSDFCRLGCDYPYCCTKIIFQPKFSMGGDKSMEYCELSKEEQERRKTIAEHTRSMILNQMSADDQDDTSIMLGYRDYYLQISFSALHPLMVICLARSIQHVSSAKKKKMVNELNLKSVLGSHAINESVGCYSYRATQWLDTEISPQRYFEMLNRCVDEADRAYQVLAS